MEKLEILLHKQIQRCPGRISLYVQIDEWQFGHNEQDLYSSASLIKIPILIEAFRQVDRGKLFLDDEITVNKEAVVGGSGVLQALNGPSSWSIHDLLTVMIIVSDNVATNVLIDILGFEAINQCMIEMGLKKTKLQRKMMDFHAQQQGLDNTTCALDIVQCLRNIHIETLLSEKSRSLAKSILRFQQFKQLGKFINDEKVYFGGKTGGLPGVEHDCAFLTYKERTAYMAILIDEIPEGKSGEQVMQQIGKIVYDSIVM